MQKAMSSILSHATRLKPSSTGGFEDLVRRLYEAWTGQRAYLAASGAQPGGDAGGDTANVQADCISCKRYNGRSPGERDVLGEFQQALLANPELDLWILACTSAVSKQVADALAAVGRKDGVPTMIIDHDAQRLSDIVVFIAGQSETAASFLAEHADQFDAAEFENAVAQVKSAPEFESKAAALKGRLTAPESGGSSFRAAAKQKLLNDLSDRRAAMKRFHQALTPMDQNESWIARPQYENQLSRWRQSDAPSIAILGEEMMGKTYLAAHALADIASADDGPLTLFVPSKMARAGDDAETLLARACVAAADARMSEKWWRRRWRRLISSRNARCVAVVVIDGLNERSSIEWSPLIRELEEIAGAGLLKVIYTVRPRCWRTRLTDLKSLSIQEMEVRHYSDSELTSALQSKGLGISDFSGDFLRLLRTPGYFSLAIELRDRLREDVSIYRLTWEEWRYRRERRQGVSLTSEEFWNFVRAAAKKNPLDATLRLDEIQSMASFAAEAVKAREELIDAHIFEADGEFLPAYKITKRFAALGLGAYLLQELGQAGARGEDIHEALERALEPQADTDFKSEIVASALFISVQGDSAPRNVVDLLTDTLLMARNRSLEATYLLLSAIGRAPSRMQALAERYWSGRGDHEAQDVITEAFVRKRDDPRAQPAIVAAFNRWMRFVHPHGGTLFLNGPSDERARETRKAISERIGHELAPGDDEFRGEKIAVIDDEMMLRLRSMALYVMSGGELAPFAEAIRGWAAAGAAMHDWDPMEQVDWVLRTAPGDTWAVMSPHAEALSATGDIDLMRAAYQIADAVGTEEANEFRDSLPDDLFPLPEQAEIRADIQRRREDPKSGFYAPDEAGLRAAMNDKDIKVETIAHILKRDALDPDLNPPAEFIDRLGKSASAHGETLHWSGRFTTGEQINFERLEPMFAVFAPEALTGAYCKTVQRLAADAIAGGELDRKAALGLAIHIHDCAIILDDETLESVRRVHTLAQTALGATKGEEKARDTLHQIEHSLFEAIFPRLPAWEQYCALVNRPQDADLLRRYANAMKPLSADEVKRALADIGEMDCGAWAPALWFLAASPAPPNAQDAAKSLAAMFGLASTTARGMLFRIFSAWRLGGLEGRAKEILSAIDGAKARDQQAWLRGHALIYLARTAEAVESYAQFLTIDELSRVAARRRDDAALMEGLGRAIDERLQAVLAPRDELPDAPNNVIIEIDEKYGAEGDTASVMSIDANRGRSNTMTAANRGGRTSVADHPFFEREEDFDARVDAIFKAVRRLHADESTSWWRAEFSITALRTLTESAPDRAANWVALLESASGRVGSPLWRVSGFLSLLSIALMPHNPPLALRAMRLAREQDDFGRVNFVCAGTVLPLEMVEIFSAPATKEIEIERRRAIDDATSDAELAIIAGCAAIGGAEDWLISEARRRCSEGVLLERGKALMLAALVGASDPEFDAMVEESGARRNWLETSLSSVSQLRKRTRWVKRHIDDAQSFRGKKAYFTLRAARPFIHAALQASINRTLAGNEGWFEFELQMSALKRDVEKRQRDWEKKLFRKKIDHRMVRVSSRT